MDRCKLEQRDPKLTFIREASSAPEMLIVLANSFQLAGGKRFCTNPAHFSVLGVDVTFNIGDYYVCLTTYRDLMLKTQSGVNPVMLGPILLPFAPTKTFFVILHPAIHCDSVRHRPSRNTSLWNRR